MKRLLCVVCALALVLGAVSAVAEIAVPVSANGFGLEIPANLMSVETKGSNPFTVTFSEQPVWAMVNLNKQFVSLDVKDGTATVDTGDNRYMTGTWWTGHGDPVSAVEMIQFWDPTRQADAEAWVAEHAGDGESYVIEVVKQRAEQLGWFPNAPEDWSVNSTIRVIKFPAGTPQSEIDATMEAARAEEEASRGGVVQIWDGWDEEYIRVLKEGAGYSWWGMSGDDALIFGDSRYNYTAGRSGVINKLEEKSSTDFFGAGACESTVTWRINANNRAWYPAIIASEYAAGSVKKIEARYRPDAAASLIDYKVDYADEAGNTYKITYAPGGRITAGSAVLADGTELKLVEQRFGFKWFTKAGRNVHDETVKNAEELGK